MDTSAQYDRIITHCQQLFEKKTADYGTAWRIMRLPSITDQLYIKAQRIRTLEEKRVSRVGDGVQEEYVGIVNYCVIAIMQLSLTGNGNENLPLAEVIEKYNQVVTETKELMFAKNHDYGEAWREMRLTSLTDLILTKIYRVKQIENNEGLTVVSEGVKANYQDMLNYAVFALIKLGLADR
ncbi:hypothetical protein GCM10011386_42740 [Parapedobacter defluvii]|uniref:Nucleotide modification associated domain-containing protein n=1 Tax=Parapedobacter defluvii TaxID=2045106 RepID=A0ABQ1MWG1_9SPHI|nr:DUF1599 domain-containing protein [Parapedobacter defluvii]RQP20081.1 MAG: DUF1599 domain-containing protein [Parapedobacter sp.]GGC45925.1 hypothetical protein GCM10011386_42740 [Parapedobacter defluvii]